MEKKIMYGHYLGVVSYWDKITQYEIIKETEKQVDVIDPNGRTWKVMKNGKLFNTMEEAVEYAKNGIQTIIDTHQWQLNLEKEKMAKFKKQYNQ